MRAYAVITGLFQGKIVLEKWIGRRCPGTGFFVENGRWVVPLQTGYQISALPIGENQGMFNILFPPFTGF